MHLNALPAYITCTLNTATACCRSLRKDNAKYSGHSVQGTYRLHSTASNCRSNGQDDRATAQWTIKTNIPSRITTKVLASLAQQSFPSCPHYPQCIEGHQLNSARSQGKHVQNGTTSEDALLPGFRTGWCFESTHDTGYGTLQQVS